MGGAKRFQPSDDLNRLIADLKNDRTGGMHPTQGANMKKPSETEKLVADLKANRTQDKAAHEFNVLAGGESNATKEDYDAFDSLSRGEQEDWISRGIDAALESGLIDAEDEDSLSAADMRELAANAMMDERQSGSGSLPVSSEARKLINDLKNR